ncbi:hypothetical protein HNR65_003109 [Desulfosalsimonas propionicica]|uniref:VWA domain-containing protein n=1 Tax=Desulfosalsimonas propionicica TaxID=332175 RepID=A0A7W0HLW6_9BACT|nr:VWA domain-containing protein [Desulfosalsimonas propionicica]MBA2882754.1 hypothetical protein [Desulfosalsimonas propionicica]
MIDRLIQFAAACRAADLRVSTAELIDCHQHLQCVDLVDEARFKTVLRANFAKSRRDQAAFDRVYDLFFHGLGASEDEDVQHMDAKAAAELLSQAGMGDDDLDAALFDFVTGDPASFLQVLQDLDQQADAPSASGVKSNLGQLAGRMQVMLRINAIQRGLARLPDGTSQAPAAASASRRLNQARGLLTRQNQPYNDGLRQVRSHHKHYQGLGEQFFSSLTPAEIEQMRDVIQQLVRKLKDRMGRRFAASRRGGLDVRKTLRRAGRFQGVPLELSYRRRPLRKTRIVALCDVSGSVWSAARFMLHLLYSLQDCFSSVHSFAFVSGTTDISEIFAHNEVNRALEKVLSSPDIGFDALTDYGEVFYEFRQLHMHRINRKTTVIIVGDGRSNYQHPRESILAEIREKARRIIWLNPEPEAFWGTGDSEMHTYKAHCHEVRTCQNLNQLIDFIEELVL